jgi:uncharacterized protein YjbI with pentapeptide repeats
MSKCELAMRRADAKRARSAGGDARPDLQRLDLRGELLSQVNFDHSDLLSASFECARLQGASFIGADLTGASLRFADLRNAVLRGSTLDGADLRDSDLNNCDLRNSSLVGAKLEGAAGLQVKWLAGADLTCAGLPSDVGSFESLKHVNEVSQIARPIFLTIITICFYSLLTLATTKDADLLTNTAASALPVIQTEFPIAWFYLVAPFVIVLVFVYFHLYLQRLWAALAALPAIFPDGQSLDKKAYPWLLNGLVRANFERLRKDRARVSYLENAVSIFLVWWLVPLTISLFWSRYLSRQDWPGTHTQIACIVAAIGLGAASFRSMSAYLRDFEEATISNRALFKKWAVFSGSFVTVFTLAFYLGSLGILQGAPPGAGGDSATHRLNVVPMLFDGFGYTPYAYLQERDVSIKPPSWTGAQNIEVVRGADLRGRRLRYANAVRAFLVNADLRETDLSGANLTNADLRGARLQEATLNSTNLTNADLTKANLAKANLAKADLTNAELRGAKLNEATLAGTNLLGANFSDANLSSVKGLSPKQLALACGNSETLLPAGFTITLCPEPI